MLTDLHIHALTSILTIEDLLAFLRDELDWPLTSESVEDVTFTYEPEELGLKPEHAPKINVIYQIRNFVHDQPWGIFFIDFENKKLPVTLMRRILNHLVVKKRGQHSAVGQVWNTRDLLFMSTYGEELNGMREVAFAHFHQTEGDLPTLRVVDWHGGDTPTKLRDTYADLKANLGWPTDPANKDEWRTQWSKPFRHKSGHEIKTAAKLAQALADLSRKIRDNCNLVLAAETETGKMTKLYKAFQSALIHDLKPEDFADTIAQTVAYGLFSAAVSRRYPEERGSKSLTSETVSQIVPETSPFLREILETFVDVSGRKKGLNFDEIGVQDVVDLLRSDETDMRSILADFGNRKPGEDPVIHFYEHYLAAYNKALKVKRGVFYTPQPVVSYIVRSVHELLQTEFGPEDGLASTVTWAEMASRDLPGAADGVIRHSSIVIPDGTDPDSPFVVILDPATGTATFLVEVIDVIHKHLKAKWDQDSAATIALLRQPQAADRQPQTFEEFWNAYVPDHLLPRLYGYELMMAPYAIAHMKVGLKLGETGYKFGSDRRVRIYLTNALEPPSELQARLALDWEALAHEAQAVKAVKETERFTVVIGNPPYSGASANMTEQAQTLIEPYRAVDGKPLGERKLWLQNDYVKFLALAQGLIAGAGCGLLGMITDNSYLDGPTFRGLRASYYNDFARITITDLHGNTKKLSADGTESDVNVFDITQGVAIINARRGPMSRDHLNLIGLVGTREHKYLVLGRCGCSQMENLPVDVRAPWYIFATSSDVGREEYNQFHSIQSVMPLQSVGIQTSRDHLAIDFTRGELLDKVHAFARGTESDEEIRSRYFPGKQVADYSAGDTRGWSLAEARRKIARLPDIEAPVVKIHYRPFDFRYLYYSPLLIDWPRFEVSDQMLSGSNLGLCVLRRTENDREYDYISASRFTISNHQASLKDGTYLLPLHVGADHRIGGLFHESDSEQSNLSPAFLDALTGVIGRRFESGGSSGGHGGLFAESDGAVSPDAGTVPPGGGASSPRAEIVPPGAGTIPPGGGAIPPSASAAPPLASATVQPASASSSVAPAPSPSAAALSQAAFSPEDVFHYIYAVLHSPAYRARYAEFLKIDFPRIPLSGGPDIFDALVPLGAELVALHLLESPTLDTPITTFVEPRTMFGEARVEKVTFTPLTTNGQPPTGHVWIDKAQTVGFHGVPEAVWNFHIGGYQVCEKWLKDRGPKKGKPGRILSPEDITHYQKIVVALNETIRLMAEIDVAIESHGGWPGAFRGGSN